MKWLIYKHTLLIGDHKGWSYIGQTNRTIKARAGCNGCLYKGCIKFYNAIKKYGWENFKHEVLEDNIKSVDEANLREQYWIAYYHTYIKDPLCRGYNMTDGGYNYTHILSEEIKQKISESNKGRISTDECRRHLSESLKGKPKSAEAIEKNRLAHIGKRQSEETKEKRRQKQLGTKRSAKAKANIKQGKRDKSGIPIVCIETGISYRSAADAYEAVTGKPTNTNATHILDVCRGKRNIAYGYHWQFKKQDQ